MRYLSNPTKLANTFISEKNIKISQFTVSNYSHYFVDAFLIEKDRRYDDCILYIGVEDFLLDETAIDLYKYQN